MSDGGIYGGKLPSYATQGLPTYRDVVLEHPDGEALVARVQDAPGGDPRTVVLLDGQLWELAGQTLGGLALLYVPVAEAEPLPEVDVATWRPERWGPVTEDGEQLVVRTDSGGVARIAEERRRQIEYGRTHDWDRRYKAQELERAACCVALHGGDHDPPEDWPWPRLAWKARSPVERLQVAGALMAAALDVQLHFGGLEATAAPAPPPVEGAVVARCAPMRPSLTDGAAVVVKCEREAPSTPEEELELAQRLLPRLSWRRPKSQPRWLVGSSDGVERLIVRWSWGVQGPNQLVKPPSGWVVGNDGHLWDQQQMTGTWGEALPLLRSDDLEALLHRTVLELALQPKRLAATTRDLQGPALEHMAPGWLPEDDPL